MTDRIDPGPGWRLLKEGERKPKGYEWLSQWHGGWQTGKNLGELFVGRMDPYRVRITSRITKAIATRATVRAAFPDGAMISDSIACESGLSMEMMGFVMDRWSSAKAQTSTQVSPARYIMFEIQREGEP